MKDWIKEKLDRIDELFPPDRIAMSKERWKRLWSGGKPIDRYPFTYSSASFGYYCIPPLPDSYDEHMKNCLNGIIVRGELDDDFIPSLETGCSQAAMPGLFGAEEVIRGDDRACERILQKPEDIDLLPDPSIKPGTPVYNALNLQKYMIEETRGRIPINVFDMQGPGDCCGKMFGYDNLFICAYEDPERYDKLMSKVTEGFIMFWKRQIEAANGLLIKTHLFAWDWVPDDAGVSCSVDSLVMLSPDFYENFYKPYLMRIGETFGGITVHACGNFAGIVRNVSNTPYMSGVNAGQMSVFDLVNAGMNKDMVVSCFIGNNDAENVFNFARENSLRPQLTISGVWPMTEKGMKPSEQWDEADKTNMLELHKKVLYAVRA